MNQASPSPDHNSPSSAPYSLLPTPYSLLPILLSLILLATLAIALWSAYDTSAVWLRYGLLVGGVFLMLGMAWLGQRWGEGAVGWMAVGAAWVGGVVAAYGLQATDWVTADVALGPLRQLALWIQGARPAMALPDTVNLNVAGAALAILLPTGGAGVVWGMRRPDRGGRVVGAVTLLPVGLALLTLALTESRGAWLGLAAGLLAALVGWGVLRRTEAGSRARRWLAAGWIVLLGGLSVVAFAVAVAQPQVARWLGSVGGAASTSRPELWRDMLALVRDYPLTGSGLDSTLMVDASYVRLLHVGFIYHAHNLFLQVAIEQGLPGLLGFVAVVALAMYRLLVRARPEVLALGALAALVALLVNGLVDAGLYVSRLAPLVFVAPGFALAVAAAQPAVPAVTLGRRRWGWGLVAVLIVGVVLVILPPFRAVVLANLGAVAQSRAELAVYRWPDVPIQDELRRMKMVDLAPAIGHYQAALALDPDNVTANRRLGQIELSIGDQAAARQHLERAYTAAPGERATRQLLAEVYAVAGEAAQARALWDTVDTSQGQLDGRVWWYDHLGDVEARQRMEALRR